MFAIRSRTVILGTTRGTRVGESRRLSRTFPARYRVLASRKNQHASPVCSPVTRCGLAFVLLVCVSLHGYAAEVIPPKPAGYFNDYAGVVSKEAALRFNEQLAQFERDTSNQIWVVVYPKMQSDSDIADYTYRVKDSWHVGQKGRNNGAVLFVFVNDHKMRIETGYGLEGALPDITCRDIIANVIAPRFKENNYEAGLAAGIASMLQAVRGEYTGSGKTALERNGQKSPRSGGIILFIVFVILLILVSRAGRKRRGYGYSSGGGPFVGGWGGGGGGWSSGSSGGGFSGSFGGGGMGGGGGASGSW
jgi:uncharacterized protein